MHLHIIHTYLHALMIEPFDIIADRFSMAFVIRLVTKAAAPMAKVRAMAGERGTQKKRLVTYVQVGLGMFAPRTLPDDKKVGTII